MLGMIAAGQWLVHCILQDGETLVAAWRLGVQARVAVLRPGDEEVLPGLLGRFFFGTGIFTGHFFHYRVQYGKPLSASATVIRSFSWMNLSFAINFFISSVTGWTWKTMPFNPDHPSSSQTLRLLWRAWPSILHRALSPSRCASQSQQLVSVQSSSLKKCKLDIIMVTLWISRFASS